MEIPKTYNPRETEDKWYKYWMDKKFFRSVPDEREPYTIVIPPPNVTGVLHMGHMLNNTIQDVLIRRARMQGKNACWVPGTDHASIATEAKVVAMLKERGIEKKDITREAFLNYAWDWREKYGGIILKQLEKLGASCDWERTRFTMEEDLSEAVIDVFIHLHKKGLIYRGIRMVNWDPKGKTAVSDEEVIRKEVNQKLYYIRYQLSGISNQVSGVSSQVSGISGQVSGVSSQVSGVSSQVSGISSQVSGISGQVSGTNDLGRAQTSNLKPESYIIIATTRPETIMADSAICINPNDERYGHLKGKTILIPLINRKIPVIEDDYVDMEFGTGCLKVTPAHDLNDYELGVKHKLPVIDILNDDGTLNSKAQILIGEDRFAARKKIVVMLEEAGQLEKVEEYKSQVGFSERTDAVIEPKLSMQWFCKMDEMAKPALDDVVNGAVNLIPDKYMNTYRYWMENVKDWCISRQLWWGQQIPAWYFQNEEPIIAKTKEEAIDELIRRYDEKDPMSEKGKSDLQLQASELIRQDEDVVDTWFSSWLWPMSVFDPAIFSDPAKPGNADINYYYPTNDLITAPEILFFWVARMIMAGHEFRGKKPFTNVYLTGIVRDKMGRKMSKSLGNSPDPIDLIEKHGADGVRVGMLLCSPAGNDLMFDESYCEQGRNFANKIWNAFRLVKGWEVDVRLENPNAKAIEWFDNRFNEALAEIEDDYNQYRISEALMNIYKLVWDDFCSWYLEMIKPSYEMPVDEVTYNKTVLFFENILKLVHPFMPFISEELWHDEVFGKRNELDCCIVSQYPVAGKADKPLLKDVEAVKEIISEVRNIRNARSISPKIALPLAIKVNSKINYELYLNIIFRMANISQAEFVNEQLPGASAFLAGTDEFFVSLDENVDPDQERERLEKEITYLHGFLDSVNKKLSNERFVQNAKKEIVDNELKKKADAEEKIRILQGNLDALE